MTNPLFRFEPLGHLCSDNLGYDPRNNCLAPRESHHVSLPEVVVGDQRRETPPPDAEPERPLFSLPRMNIAAKDLWARQTDRKDGTQAPPPSPPPPPDLVQLPGALDADASAAARREAVPQPTASSPQLAWPLPSSSFRGPAARPSSI